MRLSFMRRLPGFLLLTMLLAAGLMTMPRVTLRSPANQIEITLPGTNTPAPTSFSFATNSPAGPSATPTATLTPTDTPTDTATATFTPTNSPTPTDTPSP